MSIQSKEFELIHQCFFNREDANLSGYLTEPNQSLSPEFLTFVGEETKRREDQNQSSLTNAQRRQITICIVIGLLGLPRSNADHKDSVYRLLAPLVNKSSHTLQSDYRKHKSYIYDIVAYIELYRDDKHEVPTTDWPVLCAWVQLTDCVRKLIISG